MKNRFKLDLQTFAAEIAILCIVFDKNIKSVSVSYNAGFGNTNSHTWSSSGESFQTKCDDLKLTFDVVLKEGYVLDTVTISDISNDESVEIISNNQFIWNKNDGSGGLTGTITLTSKQTSGIVTKEVSAIRYGGKAIKNVNGKKLNSLTIGNVKYMKLNKKTSEFILNISRNDNEIYILSPYGFNGKEVIRPINLKSFFLENISIYKTTKILQASRYAFLNVGNYYQASENIISYLNDNEFLYDRDGYLVIKKGCILFDFINCKEDPPASCEFNFDGYDYLNDKEIKKIWVEFNLNSNNNIHIGEEFDLTQMELNEDGFYSISMSKLEFLKDYTVLSDEIIEDTFKPANIADLPECDENPPVFRIVVRE